MAFDQRPLPKVDADSSPYWESAKAHAVRMQQCKDCGRFRFYPSPACHFCASLAFTWELISGRGEVYSWSVLERAKGNMFADLVPMTLVMVTLDEGPTMLSNLVDHEGVPLAVGMRVEMTYEDVNDEITLPLFRPASQ